MPRRFSLILLLSCALGGPLLRAGEVLRVSTFSSVLTEIAEQVGGVRVAVHGHVKAGVDPHEFEPKPADLEIVSASHLVLLSAKHMEGYVGKLQEATGAARRIVEVGDQFPSLKLSAEEGGGVIDDPHWWHSIANVQRAVKVVRDELTKLSPADRETFAKQAEAYLAQLEALQKWVKAKLAELPRDRRKLVTSHDAFQYFARENGFTIYAVEGVSSTDQPSSKKVADLIRTIKEQRVKAVFIESLENPKVLAEITKETGAKIGGSLFADGLGEGDAATYAGMMKHNVTTIVEALK